MPCGIVTWSFGFCFCSVFVLSSFSLGLAVAPRRFPGGYLGFGLRSVKLNPKRFRV